jgi:Asp-tRNA(Asn)/Glu-tRNA(Gln) amidotransferase A subunit family amidase
MFRAESLSRRVFLMSAGAACLRAEAPRNQLSSLGDWLNANAKSRAAGVKMCLERIRIQDPRIQAWVQVLPQQPTGQGPLSGIPFGAKDVIETRGLATEFGSPVYKGRKGEADAAIIRELRVRGAILLGKTQTCAFAMRDPPPTRNPRNLEHTPGGSSSGSAAAVAAGMAPFSIGTQTAGSVLRPASYCGVTGFKPSFGTLSTEGVLPFARNLDTLGFFTTTPSDMLLLWEALGRSGGEDADFSIGILGSLPGCEAVMMSELNRAVKVLREAGFRQRPVDISALLTGLLNAHHTIMYFEGARFHEKRFQEYGDRLGYLAQLVREGLKITQSDYEKALRAVSEGKARMSDIYRKTPVLLGPAATGPAPLGLKFTGNASMNSPWTALGGPAISIPMPVAAGLPLGMQLTSAMGDDARLLRTAAKVYRVLHGE